MHTTPRWSTLAAALSISLTACDGLPMEPSLGLETGEAALSLAALTHTDVVIDFEDVDLPPTGTGVTLLATYSEDGFTLVHSGGGFSSPGVDNPLYVGSKTLFPLPSGGGVTSLTEDGGGAFNVVSIGLAEVFVVLGPVTVTFTGRKTDGSTVSETFTTDGIFGLKTKTFPASFTDVVSLSWTQDWGSLHHFGNIALSFGSSGPVNPTTRDDCKKGGWADFGFRNQGQCVRFVETGKDRR